jgi:hypothetical protein
MVDARTSLSQVSSPSTFVMANEIQEAVGQLSYLRKGIIHLRDPVQLLLRLWAKLLWTGQHPSDDLPWGHVFEERARETLTQGWWRLLAWLVK